MILDSGICSIYRKQNISQPGAMPVVGYVLISRGWYKELDFATAPTWRTEGREEQRADGRIRIWQNRSVNQYDLVILRDTTEGPEEGDTLYKITRAWHGTDEEGADLISDLTLEVVRP